jgi:uncharacterized protein YcnI
VRKKLLAGLFVGVLGLGSAASVAGAHVTANPGEAAPGGFAKISFRVPNERPDSSTIRLELKMPEDHPIGHVSVRSVPGWEVDVQSRTLDEPIDVFGEELTEVVDTITWSGGEIAPGQFEEFDVSMGPLPEDAESLLFPAIQVYDNEEEVAWIEETPEGGEEPEHPAPVVVLTGAPADGHAEEEGEEGGEGAAEENGGDGGSGGELAAAGATTDALNALSDDVDQAKQFGLAGIAVGVVGVIMAIWAVVSHRSDTST